MSSDQSTTIASANSSLADLETFLNTVHIDGQKEANSLKDALTTLGLDASKFGHHARSEMTALSEAANVLGLDIPSEENFETAMVNLTRELDYERAAEERMRDENELLQAELKEALVLQQAVENLIGRQNHHESPKTATEELDTTSVSVGSVASSHGGGVHENDKLNFFRAKTNSYYKRAASLKKVLKDCNYDASLSHESLAGRGREIAKLEEDLLQLDKEVAWFCGVSSDATLARHQLAQKKAAVAELNARVSSSIID